METGKRTDPIEIIGRTGGVQPMASDFSRGLDLWCHLATKAGWSVSIISRDADSGAGLCGVVDVESVEYRILYGQRTRTMLVYDDPEGVERVMPALAYAV